VLDVGCGPGHMLIKGAELRHRMVGVDLSPSALSSAYERLRRRGLAAELIEGSFPNDLASAGRFDCILLHHVLSSLDRKERHRSVEGAREMLNDGGSVHFLDLSVNDLRYGSGELIEERTYLKGNGIPEHFFTVAEVSDLFEGFRYDDLREVSWSQRTREGPRRRSRIEGLFYTV